MSHLSIFWDTIIGHLFLSENMFSFSRWKPLRAFDCFYNFYNLLMRFVKPQKTPLLKWWHLKCFLYSSCIDISLLVCRPKSFSMTFRFNWISFFTHEISLICLLLIIYILGKICISFISKVYGLCSIKTFLDLKRFTVYSNFLKYG